MSDIVYEPFKIGSIDLRNRIVRTAHGLPLPWVDQSDALIDYYVERARGGTGLTILGAATVHPTGVSAIPVSTDRIIPGYQKLAAELHRHGSRVFQQLSHHGATRPNALGGAPWSASAIPSPALGAAPRSMTQSMIDEMVEAFASAALRAAKGGLDGVELHAGHGYLIHQFLSPATNQRTDNYGGTLENRLRFLREIIAEIRDTVGDQFALGVRLSSEELVEGGIDIDEAQRIACGIESTIDFIDVSYSSYFRPELMAAGHDSPLGYELESTRQITKVLQVPTIVTGRIMTIDHAEHVIKSGIADLVSIVRAMIADPDLVAKTRSGRTAEIRPCTGSGQGCMSETGMPGANFRCVVNPRAGRENVISTDPEPAEQALKVLVVGGGPAGLEVARTAALRGHKVTLMEMKRVLGGQVAIAARAPHRSDYGAITSWLADELNRLNVDVRLNTPVDPDVIDDFAPDVLVVATGSEPRRDCRQVLRPIGNLPGSNLRHVYSSWDVLGVNGIAELGSSVLVYDDVGTYDALSTIDALLARNVHVTYATRFATMGASLTPRMEVLGAIMRRISEGGVDSISNAHITEITSNDVELAIGNVRIRKPADTVVFVGVNDSNDQLSDPEILGDFAGTVHVIGDANGDRTLTHAIHTADEVGRLI